MPKQHDIHKVLVIGSGPIVIGQAAEFDYSGTQACKALKEEGLSVVLINNNPATIMTDKTFADEVYFEPMTVESVEEIIKKEKPDGILASVGGQTGLNLAMELHQKGVLSKYNVKLLGTSVESIMQAEDRDQFRALMQYLNEPVPESEIVHSENEALHFGQYAGYPIIVRPAYTLGGFGGGIAENEEKLSSLIRQGLSASPISQCLVEKSIAGFKEIEYEVMRDFSGTCITVCNMENLDPVGVHTGDSVVVAPSQTLDDQQYHMLRSASIKIIEELKIIGGCNIQFALHPTTNEYYLIEVNPRVSRSSALASKATGYPIAKIAAKLAAGYQLYELKNPVTGTTYASFEPALDYVTVKIPRWPFDKFPEADRKLGTQMKATGEVMAIERSMEGAFQKAIRSLELKTDGMFLKRLKLLPEEELLSIALEPTEERLFALLQLLRNGYDVQKLISQTGITPYFLFVLNRLITAQIELEKLTLPEADEEILARAKQLGFSDKQLSAMWNCTENDVRSKRKECKVLPSYKMVDTCAAEFEARTSYYYSSWSGNSDKAPKRGKKVAVIGSGPIRIGQGVEFDYCCVHSVIAAQNMGYETIMINNNPETVSTDYEIADALYFEPLTAEDVLNVLEFEGIDKVILQFGGQTSINLAKELEEAGIAVLGAGADIVDQMEDRERFYAFLEKCRIDRVPGKTAAKKSDVLPCAEEVGFPVLLRPSYVIGGSGMKVFEDAEALAAYVNDEQIEYPVLVDHFLIGLEAEVDCLTDGSAIFIPGIFEHLEGTGVHSGDSISATPPVTLSEDVQKKIRGMSEIIARNMDYKGLFNIQFAIEGSRIYVLEINPRASRTVPIISKVTDVPLVQRATQLLLGSEFCSLSLYEEYNEQPYFTVKAPVYSHIKLPGLSPALSPVMTSTGEVIGTSSEWKEALYKSLKGASPQLADLFTEAGSIYVEGTPESLDDAEVWEELGFTLAYSSTSDFNEWMQNESSKKAVISLKKSDDKIVKEAALNRLHVWTRSETAAAYLTALQHNTKDKAGMKNGTYSAV
ncbi:carbamoyl phosphate synthase large subunit [Fictibacillus aquaticus]|uniref:carbamoyl phosphate synthase large subunit n=1 Tax=Fictibacillus aquaticus TaxID=2021314 RepID=UPI0035E811A3